MEIENVYPRKDLDFVLDGFKEKRKTANAIEVNGASIYGVLHPLNPTSVPIAIELVGVIVMLRSST